MIKRYISLNCAEKAIRNLIGWHSDGATFNTIKNRNECLEVLSQVEDFIDIEGEIENEKDKY